ncbi:MAG: AMP-binding protein [Candidatus Rokubacteria bacterium]|nr:AMP-binding protein [Candidatus Rokubacteria bacterium]
MGENIFATGLGRGDANSAALTPVSFLPHTAAIHPDRTAIVHGARRVTYREYDARARRLASALAARGIGPGDTVAVVLPNVPAMLEVHQAVPAIGAVLNAVNTRLDARTIAYILGHGEARALIVDREFSPSVGAALAQLERKPLVIDHDDPLYDGPGPRLGGVEYEDLLAEGSPDFAPAPIRDEWQPIALNYTSGTTGNPKGVVAHHRGVWMMLVGEILAWHIPAGAVYLWTLPMFHANGWGFPWAITAVGGTHVCLRRVEPATIFRLLAEQRVTHMCGAPTVLNMLINAPAESRPPRDHVVDLMTGGAAPPAKILRAMSELGFRVQHIYGLTEVLGPSTLCAWQDGWATLTPEERAARQARQGVPYHVVEGQRVADPKTIEPVPADGTTLGEVMLRGNTVMLGYLKDRAATDAAFAGGWFHTGDLAVQHPDGYIEIRDRSKDIIISGGENISSLMVEAALTRHPAVALAAVVARPDEKWGETPCAFVELRPGTGVTAEALIAFARANLPHFAVPKTVIFGPLPATATGKIQKFELRQRARAL